MQLFAPAKINLSFKILRRREDGFHEIETLMAPISLCDELTIEPNESGFVFSVDDPSLPAGEDNLVVRAARSFFGEMKEEPRVRITLRKKIPHGAGLGGGSSDAASTLLGLESALRWPPAVFSPNKYGGWDRLRCAVLSCAKCGVVSGARGDCGAGGECRRCRSCF